VIVVVGPVLGGLGRASAADGIVGSLAVGVIAGWLLGEALHIAFGHEGGPWPAGAWNQGAIRWQAHEMSSRWFSVAVNASAAICWMIASRGPTRVVAAVLVPMTAVAAAALTTAGPLLGPTVASRTRRPRDGARRQGGFHDACSRRPIATFPGYPAVLACGVHLGVAAAPS
jgi:hypothetical protein